MLKVVVLLVVFFVFPTHPCQAQHECDSILRYGIWDIRETVAFRQKEQALYNWARSRTSDTSLQRRMTKGEGSVFLPLEVPIEVGSKVTYDKETQRQLLTATERNSLETMRDDRRWRSFVQTASEFVTGAWTRCMERQVAGLRFGLLTTYDPNRFVIVTKYVDPHAMTEKGEPPRTALFKGLEADGDHITCETNLQKETGDRIGQNERVINCHRYKESQDKGGVVTIYTDREDQWVQISPFAKPKAAMTKKVAKPRWIQSGPRSIPELEDFINAIGPSDVSGIYGSISCPECSEGQLPDIHVWVRADRRHGAVSYQVTPHLWKGGDEYIADLNKNRLRIIGFNQKGKLVVVRQILGAGDEEVSNWDWDYKTSLPQLLKFINGHGPSDLSGIQGSASKGENEKVNYHAWVRVDRDKTDYRFPFPHPWSGGEVVKSILEGGKHAVYGFDQRGGFVLVEDMRKE